MASDKLQALMDAANEVAKSGGYVTLTIGLREALESFRAALASGEVVVTTWHDHGDFCSARDGITCLHSHNLNAKCTRTNCPRLPHA